MVRYLLSIVLFFTVLSASAQLTYQTLYVDYDSAWTFKNLKIIPIRRRPDAGVPRGLDVVPLGRAMSQGLVEVTERGTTSFDNVHWLRLNTKSNKSIYISGGEIISGGRQDRMVIHDTILKPSSKDQYVPVMCVEEGRWSEKEKQFGYANYANTDLRRILDSTHNQALIWREVDRQLQEGKYKNNTLSFLSRYADKKYVAGKDEYMKFFLNRFAHSDSTIIGFIAISGDKVIGSDTFDGTGLFYPQLEPLLQGYVDQAMTLGAPVSLKDGPVKKYADGLFKDEPTQEKFVKDKGKIFKEEGRVTHVNTFVKETPGE